MSLLHISGNSCRVTDKVTHDVALVFVKMETSSKVGVTDTKWRPFVVGDIRLSCIRDGWSIFGCTCVTHRAAFPVPCLVFFRGTALAPDREDGDVP